MTNRTIGVLLCTAALAGCTQQEVPPPEPVQAIPDAVRTPEDIRELRRGERSESQADEPNAEPERDRIADDGRPEWWFPEVREEDNELVLCVETIATGLRAAGQRASDVAEGRARLETERRGYVFDTSAMRVPNSWVWPLQELPGMERRYAGYALVRIDLAMLSAQ